MKNAVKELQQIIENKSKDKAKSRRKSKQPVEDVHLDNVTVTKPKLEVIHEAKLLYRGRNVNFNVLGLLPQDLSSFKVTLQVTENDTEKRDRYKLDLYEPDQIKRTVESIAIKFLVKEDELEADFQILIDLLEKYRDAQLEAQRVSSKKPLGINRIMVPTQEKAAMDFLSAGKLMERTDKLLCQAGIIGQEKIRLLAFLACASFKSDMPLHLGITGEPNNVCTFINSLAQCLTPEDSVILGNVSGRSFYHCTNGELMNKILVLPNGIDKKAGAALSQLQQEKSLSTATTIKDRLGNMVSSVKQVQSHFSTIMHTNTAHENSIGKLMVCLDESKEQIMKNINYQNEKFSGIHNSEDEMNSMESLKFIVRCLKSLEVTNPYANKIVLPVNANAQIKMNHLFQALVKQVCLFHQYQRKKDEHGRLLAEIEDMRIVGEMLFDAMVMETDELDSAQRELYEGIKCYVKKKAEDKVDDYRFTLREIRSELNMSKNCCFRYMQELHKLEYVERIGYANRGFKYRIVYWDDAEKIKTNLKNDLNNQLAALGGLSDRTPHRPPSMNGGEGLSAGGLTAA